MHRGKVSSEFDQNASHELLLERLVSRTIFY